MQHQAVQSRNSFLERIVLLVVLIVSFHRTGSAAQVEQLTLGTQQVRIAAGEIAVMELPPASAEFVRQGVKLSAETLPHGLLRISVGQDAKNGTLVVAPPPTMPPGIYSVEISATDSAGEQQTATL